MATSQVTMRCSRAAARRRLHRPRTATRKHGPTRDQVARVVLPRECKRLTLREPAEAARLPFGLHAELQETRAHQEQLAMALERSKSSEEQRRSRAVLEESALSALIWRSNWSKSVRSGWAQSTSQPQAWPRRRQSRRRRPPRRPVRRRRLRLHVQSWRD